MGRYTNPASLLFKTRLLQHPPVRQPSTNCNTSKSTLSVICKSRGSNDTKPLTSLAPGEAAGYIAGGSDDIQGLSQSNSSVCERLDLEPRTHGGSFGALLLVVPWTQTKLACGAFSVVAPSIWNSLLADICLCQSLSTFRLYL